MNDDRKPPRKEAEIVNLRLARKEKKRSDKAKTAAENRAAFGRTKAEKAAAKAESARSTRSLDAHRRSRDDEDGKS